MQLEKNITIKKEENPIWDERKNYLFAIMNSDCFSFKEVIIGDKLPGIWYVMEEDTKIVGYSFVRELKIPDYYEIEMVIDSSYQKQKLGTTLLIYIENELRNLGKKRILGIIKKTNPNRHQILEWLIRNGFSADVFGNNVDKIAFVINRQDITFTKIL